MQNLFSKLWKISTQPLFVVYSFIVLRSSKDQSEKVDFMMPHTIQHADSRWLFHVSEMLKWVPISFLFCWLFRFQFSSAQKFSWIPGIIYRSQKIKNRMLVGFTTGISVLMCRDWDTQQILQYIIGSSKAHVNVKYQLVYIYIQKSNTVLCSNVKHFWNNLLPIQKSTSAHFSIHIRELLKITCSFISFSLTSTFDLATTVKVTVTPKNNWN